MRVAPSPAWPDALRDLLSARDDENEALALRLVAERRAGDASPWAAWIRTLPATFDTPLFWSADGRASLADLRVSRGGGPGGEKRVTFGEYLFRVAEGGDAVAVC